MQRRTERVEAKFFEQFKRIFNKNIIKQYVYNAEARRASRGKIFFEQFK